MKKGYLVRCPSCGATITSPRDAEGLECEKCQGRLKLDIGRAKLSAAVATAALVPLLLAVLALWIGQPYTNNILALKFGGGAAIAIAILFYRFVLRYFIRRSAKQE